MELTTAIVDYYALLGVTQIATRDEIKTAFRHLALKHHPDKNLQSLAATRRMQYVSDDAQDSHATVPLEAVPPLKLLMTSKKTDA